MKKEKSSKITGIIGADSGCGTTLLALALANCSSSRLRRKTALIEIGNNSLCQMTGEDYEYQEGLFHFSIMGIDVFSSASLRDINQISSMLFDEIIIDFGHTKTVSHEFNSCDKKIITASFLPFRHQNLNLFLGENCVQTGAMRAEVVVYGNNKLSKQWEQRNRKRIFYMPTIADPLYIPLKDSNYLIELLKE